jgi:XTP/dITP diphosphohydrolase
VKLLLATRNAGKLREARFALGSLAELLDLSPWPELAAPAETAGTFAGNAALKALYYSRASGLLTLADDSGLEVEALGGEPGVASARWLGSGVSYDVKNRKLLELLAGRPEPERGARYVAAVALAERGEVIFTAVETCQGRVSDEPRGSGGFGYDPIFYSPELGMTFAEAGLEAKTRVSHRGKALQRVADYLRAAGPRPHQLT